MKLLIVIFIVIIIGAEIYAQIPGEKPQEIPEDTVFIFEPARPLLTMEEQQGAIKNAWGFDLVLSDSGFGFGLFYNRDIVPSLSWFISFYMSGARNTDEFELWDYELREYRVENKINRLFKFPAQIGVIQYFFQNKLTESMRPYITAGVSPTMIVSTPYTAGRVPNGEKVGWFAAFGEADVYFRMGGFFGIGAYFGAMENGLIGVHAKYFYIPFGERGLESVYGSPIRNFGGFFLGLSIGKRY